TLVAVGLRFLVADHIADEVTAALRPFSHRRRTFVSTRARTHCSRRPFASARSSTLSSFSALRRSVGLSHAATWACEGTMRPQTRTSVVLVVLDTAVVDVLVELVLEGPGTVGDVVVVAASVVVVNTVSLPQCPSPSQWSSSVSGLPSSHGVVVGSP